MRNCSQEHLFFTSGGKIHTSLCNQQPWLRSTGTLVSTLDRYVSSVRAKYQWLDASIVLHLSGLQPALIEGTLSLTSKWYQFQGFINSRLAYPWPHDDAVKWLLM